jgi:hypothetical protein
MTPRIDSWYWLPFVRHGQEGRRRAAQPAAGDQAERCVRGRTGTDNHSATQTSANISSHHAYSDSQNKLCRFEYQAKFSPCLRKRSTHPSPTTYFLNITFVVPAPDHPRRSPPLISSTVQSAWRCTPTRARSVASCCDARAKRSQSASSRKSSHDGRRAMTTDQAMHTHTQIQRTE